MLFILTKSYLISFPSEIVSHKHMQNLHKIQPVHHHPHIVLTRHPQQRFCQLLFKLQSISKCVADTYHFDSVFSIIGLTRSTVLAGLQSIYEYFVLLGRQIDQGLINRTVGDRIIQGVHHYLELQNFTLMDIKQKAIYILQFETKFSVCLQFFHTIKEHENNITTQSREKHSHVWQCIHMVDLADFRVIRRKYQNVKKILCLTTMAILTEETVQSNLVKKILFGLSYPRYYMDYATARLKCLIFYKEPTVQLAKAMWDIPQLGASKQFMKLAFEKIAFNQKIYIPFQCGDDQYPDICKPGGVKIKVRILHHDLLHLKNKPQKRKRFWFFNQPVQDKTKQFKEIDTIIIHMHGGGFIALTSRMSQYITRPWANHLKVPVFSVDYRKPPNDPFPAAADDCLTVYKFIIKKIKYYMNINPVNVYLAGDSAGGNLVCSLMGNILINKLPPPKGLYLAYPALDLRVKFSPSKINAVTDPLLWPSMLLLCLSEYLGGKIEEASNPLASPILLTEQFVGGQQNDQRFPINWPKTVISVGQMDPLYDDSLILMQKLKESNIQCSCRVYRQLAHGFMSIGFMVSECQRTIFDSIDDLKHLINVKEKSHKNIKINLSLIHN